MLPESTKFLNSSIEMGCKTGDAHKGSYMKSLLQVKCWIAGVMMMC